MVAKRRLQPKNALDMMKKLNISEPSQSNVDDFIEYYVITKGNAEACRNLFTMARLRLTQELLKTAQTQAEKADKLAKSHAAQTNKFIAFAENLVMLYAIKR